MFKHDGEGEFFGLLIGLAIIVMIVYAVIILASIIISVGAAGGTLFGGASAIKNYCSSFKENVIDSNRAPVVAA